MSLENVTNDMPYRRNIYSSLYPEAEVKLVGLIPEQSKWFYFQFADGQHRRANIALHFKAVFEKSPSVIELDGFKDGKWIGKKKLPNPWKPGERFSIRFVVTKNSYKVFAEDRLLDEFRQYLPPKEVAFFEMDGDVILEDLKFPPRFPAGH